jgi:uroporphyrinogen decarboxylase
MMTSKERVIRTLKFEQPDKVPVNLWCLPAAKLKYGDALEKLIAESEIDIISAPFADPTDDPRHFQVGSYTDVWGSEWYNRQAGIIGEVKTAPLEDFSKVWECKSPKEILLSGKKGLTETQQFISQNNDKFILGGWITIFERMQFLRGTENLLIDTFMESDEFYKLCEIVEDYYTTYLDLWLETDVDGIVFADDWGTQISLLIDPESWRRLFKPIYKRLFEKAKNAGKFVFMHSDGYILDLYDDFIELGVDAINSQVWCMGLDKVAAKCNGRITNWGEICRQNILPFGTSEDVQYAINQMKKHLWVNGGLIGQFEAAHDQPLENIKTGINGWNKDNQID